MGTPYKNILIPALLSATLLGGCANLPPLTGSPVSPQEARRLGQENQLTEASEMYTELARKTKDQASREHFLLLSAEILVDNDKYTQGGQQRIEAIPLELSSPDLQNRLSLLKAKEALIGGDIEAALTLLPNASDEHSTAIKARILEVQANAYNMLTQPAEELFARIQLDALLASDSAIETNHNLIWQRLLSHSIETLRHMTTSVYGDTYQGWLELALIPRSQSLYARQLTAKIENWHQRFPNHPATREFTNALLSEGLQALPETPTASNIAVLLPLSGKTKNAGQAIRDGIITAYLSNNERSEPPQIRFYDTNQKAFELTYQQALQEGATLIIGPLNKKFVTQLTNSSDLPVPTLALNYVENTTHLPNNLLQFGLLPEDEAISAAHRAYHHNYNNALIMHPDDATGKRMSAAFSKELTTLGGLIKETLLLPADDYDFSAQLRATLHIDASKQRHKALQSTLRTSLKFEPVIRQDIDVIYLASNAKQARLVRPQLLFFRARDIPLLASSRVNDGAANRQKDGDLNSIAFTDTRWAIETKVSGNKTQAAVMNNWPNAGSYTRLYALGADAYEILPFIENMKNTPDYRLSGNTGDLSIDENNKVHRHLPWAIFEKGRARPLDSPAKPIQNNDELLPQMIQRTSPLPNNSEPTGI